ncbi:hypothetical protein [Marinovum sp.]|uniref:hypothetical protein n=1 Tax=Marinovum sp. TaxID=2024839 RepID=UPI002B268ECE|nr:hypothetical protein [Marinovum sp.]
MPVDPVVPRLLEFVRSIGIEVRDRTLAHKTFLPGLDIQNGALIVDHGRLAYPGDILHEAGHIAVADKERRMQPVLKPTKAEEMAAAAWSYAAVCHLNLPVRLVFHEHGYSDGADAMIEAYSNGIGPGLPLLIWFGVTADPHGRQPGTATRPYPEMDRWLR